MFKPLLWRLAGALLLVVLIGATGAAQSVIISEVAWAGTQASTADEWIELYNPLDEPIDLRGWILAFGTVAIDLGQAADPLLGAGGYFLLERTDDQAVADIAADLVYAGSLSNNGAVLRLLDPSGREVDTANCTQVEGWMCGTTGREVPAFATMERADPTGPDLPSNWSANDGIHRLGCDADENPINGTPKAKNSATIIRETFPVVTLVDPVEEGEPVSGVIILSWTANDPDGAPAQLHAAVLVSADAGETWELVVEGLVGTSYAWDAGNVLPGDAYRLRVAVTDQDGNTATATSPVFEVVDGD